MVTWIRGPDGKMELREINGRTYIGGELVRIDKPEYSMVRGPDGKMSFRRVGNIYLDADGEIWKIE